MLETATAVSACGNNGRHKSIYHGDTELIRSSDFTDRLNQFQRLAISRLVVIDEEKILLFRCS